MYNILVVDDDEEIVKAIEIYLGKENYKIYKAYDGEQALKQINKNEMHLVILDIMMPNKDGLETLEEIRKDKNIPVIMLSAKSEDIDKINGLNIGADDYVTKPFNPIELIARVNALKARTLLKSSFVGRVLILISKGLVLLYRKFISIYNTVTYSTKIITKVFIYFGLILPFAILILFAFANNIMLALFLEIILLTIVLYRIIRTTKGYAQIEEKLKEMYEGKNKKQLDEQDFAPEFHSTVKYINDISNGFQNAIQDRMKSERLKAELITNVSHDIKTPLTSIITYVDLLKQENIQNEKVKEYIEILDNKSQRLKKLTEDLVEASKVSTGNISLNLENINIVQLIKQALGEFEDKFKKRGLETILDSENNEITIKADNKYMYRIIENLFSNIAKYALENSRVYIDIRKTQKSVIIEMKNISKDRLNISADELMQRFVRGDKSRTTEGSGLGISIAQNLTWDKRGRFCFVPLGHLVPVLFCPPKGRIMKNVVKFLIIFVDYLQLFLLQLLESTFLKATGRLA